MKKLKDAQLVWRIKSKRCEKSLLELVSRHSNLFYNLNLNIYAGLAYFIFVCSILIIFSI